MSRNDKTKYAAMHLTIIFFKNERRDQKKKSFKKSVCIKYLKGFNVENS